MFNGNKKNKDSLCNFIICRAGIELLQFYCNISFSFPYLLQRIFANGKLECSYIINKGSIDSYILQGLGLTRSWVLILYMVFAFRVETICHTFMFPWAHGAMYVKASVHSKTTWPCITFLSVQKRIKYHHYGFECRSAMRLNHSKALHHHD